MPDMHDEKMANQMEAGIPTSSDEVSSVSSEEMLDLTEERIREQIRRDTEMRLLYYSGGGKESINERLRELDREWSVERAFGANAAGLALFGLTFGALFGRKWYIFPLLAAGCILQQTLRGWSPPMALLRRLRLRTTAEIDSERYALKALRGDFQGIQPSGTIAPQELDRVLDAAER
jgi:hypothetical protein